jgi:hypothetical protein
MGNRNGVFINEKLIDLIFQRLVIITYELGDLCRDLFYARHFVGERKAHLANAKLSLADLFTQLSLLCRDLGFDEKELRELRQQHLQERFKELRSRVIVPIGLDLFRDLNER